MACDLLAAVSWTSAEHGSSLCASPCQQPVGRIAANSPNSPGLRRRRTARRHTATPLFSEQKTIRNLLAGPASAPDPEKRSACPRWEPPHNQDCAGSGTLAFPSTGAWRTPPGARLPRGAGHMAGLHVHPSGPSLFRGENPNARASVCTSVNRRAGRKRHGRFRDVHSQGIGGAYSACSGPAGRAQKNREPITPRDRTTGKSANGGRRHRLRGAFAAMGPTGAVRPTPRGAKRRPRHG